MEAIVERAAGVGQIELYTLSGVAIFAVCLYAVIARTHLVRKVLAINMMGSSVFLLLVALALRGSETPDPVPHAMVLTGIVVAVSATAFALALLRRMMDDGERPYLPEEEAE